MLKKNIILLFLLLLYLSTPAFANPHKGPKPIAVVSEFDEWNRCNKILEMALYEDGTLIFVECKEGEKKFISKHMKKKLTNEEYYKISKQLGPTEEFMSLLSDYILSNNIEAPNVDIYLADNQNQKLVKVSYEDFNLSGGVPKEFIRVYNLMQSIPLEGASEYEPEYLEIWLEIPQDTKVKTIPWPKKFPSLSDKYTKSYFEDTYCIYVPNEKSKEIQKYVSILKKNNKLAFLDSRKWQVYILPAFPNAAAYWEVAKVIYKRK
jgi:hypothetical protein